jgi:hypothetical protein
MKAKLVPLLFLEANDRERDEFKQQLSVLQEMYGDVAEFLEPVLVGEQLPAADAIVFPQLIGAAFRNRAKLKEYELPMVVLTSRFGTVEMWDWEIVTFLRSEGMNVFSPYSIDLAKTVIRALAARKQLKAGAKFLMFQDSPGEGMQAYIFKRFYWWEQECTERMEEIFGIKMIYRSWKAVNQRAREIDDESAGRLYKSWEINESGLSDRAVLSSVKIYMAVKEVIDEIGGVEGVGANCLNESFNSDTTPCLAWNMIFEKDDIIWACEGDTLTLLSTFILYRALRVPIMMTNIYPFLMGMAAVAHEKIDKFPEINDPDNHALGVHCGYFGLVPRQFCSSWTMCPKVLEIVDDNAIALDCELPKGRITLAKIHPDFNKLLIIEAEIVDYVQYPGSDCRNGALIRYNDGEKVMEELCSHHALILSGDQKAKLLQVARIFNWEAVVI